MRRDLQESQALERPRGLVDVLDRVLDRGIVIAGDVRVLLAEVEIVTIRIRLVVCSLDRAKEVGLDWWRSDPLLHLFATGREQPHLAGKKSTLWRRVQRLEQKVSRLTQGGDTAGAKPQQVKQKRQRRGAVPRETPRLAPEGAGAAMHRATAEKKEKKDEE